MYPRNFTGETAFSLLREGPVIFLQYHLRCSMLQSVLAMDQNVIYLTNDPLHSVKCSSLVVEILEQK